MRKTVRASTHGLQTVEERRKIQGWKKYDEQWQTKAGVSESTLKRFWKSEDLKIDTFTKICEALGFHWETIAESGSLVMGQIICDRYKILELRSDQKHRKIYLGEDLGLPYSPLCLVTQLSHHSSDKEQELLEKEKELLDREARTLHQVRQHTQIPQLYAYFKNDEQESYLIKEYIEGNPLEEEIFEGQPWSEAEVFNFLDEMLRILSFVHKRKVIHRKINPSNIIRRKSDKSLVLVHFGDITYESSKGYQTPTLSSVSQLSKHLFIPPEQGIGSPKCCSDIYSLGRIAIQMLTGKSLDNIKIEYATGNIDWHDDLDINPMLVKFLDKMVEYNYTDRYTPGETAWKELKQIVIK